MAKIIISNLDNTSNENLLTVLEPWEMKAVEGGATQDGNLNGNLIRRRRDLTIIDPNNPAATQQNINDFIAQASNQIDTTLQSLQGFNFGF